MRNGMLLAFVLLLGLALAALFASGCLHGSGESETESDDDVSDDDVADDDTDDDTDDDLAEECDRGPTEVGSCAVVVYEDLDTANAWKDFLYFNQVGVARLHKSRVVDYDFDTAFGGDPVTFLIIEPHTTWSSAGKSDEEIAGVLDALAIPILALGANGLSFLGFTSANDVGLNESALFIDSTDGFYVVNTLHDIFSSPVNIDIPDDRFLHILDAADDVAFVHLESPPSSVRPIGALEECSFYYNPVEYEGYFFFGFEQSPQAWSKSDPAFNDTGNYLIWNIVSYMIDLASD